jgi:hypothetical protein
MRKVFAALLVSLCSINAYVGGYEHLQTLSGQERFRTLSEGLGRY